MVKPGNSLNFPKGHPMKRRLYLTAAGMAGILIMAGQHSAEARLDAVSAASLSVRVPTVTTTSAVVEYFRDKYDYGTRTLCYDPAPAAARNNCVTKVASGNQGSFTVTGLKPGVQYNFRIEAIDTKDGEKPYNTTGSFTTAAATGVIAVPGAGREALPAETRFDAGGRSLPPGPAAPGAAFIHPLKAR